MTPRQKHVAVCRDQDARKMHLVAPQARHAGRPGYSRDHFVRVGALAAAEQALCGAPVGPRTYIQDRPGMREYVLSQGFILCAACCGR